MFIQGEHMGRPSEIRSRLTAEGDTVLIRVGGRAVMSMSAVRSFVKRAGSGTADPSAMSAWS